MMFAIRLKFLLLTSITFGLSSCFSCFEERTMIHATVVLESIYYGGVEISNNGYEWDFEFKINGKQFSKENIKLLYGDEKSLYWNVFDGDLIGEHCSIPMTYHITEDDPIDDDETVGKIDLICGETNNIKIPIKEDTKLSYRIVLGPVGLIYDPLPNPGDAALLELSFKVRYSEL